MTCSKAPSLGPYVFAAARSQPQQSANLLQREAKLPRPANEHQSFCCSSRCVGWQFPDDGPLDNTPEFVVPPGSLFVMGDNRDNTVDSRVGSPRFGVGYVPVELVIGRVIATF